MVELVTTAGQEIARDGGNSIGDGDGSSSGDSNSDGDGSSSDDSNSDGGSGEVMLPLVDDAHDTSFSVRLRVSTCCFSVLLLQQVLHDILQLTLFSGRVKYLCNTILHLHHYLRGLS